MADNTIEIILRTVDKMSADLANVERRLKGFEGAAKSADKGTSFFSLSLAALGGKIVVVNQALELAQKALSKFKEIAGTGEALLKLSRATQVSTQQLDGLRIVAEINETSLDELGAGIQRFLRAIGEAKDASSEQARAFKILGLSIDQLSGPNANALESFLKLADSISALKNPEDRIIAAQVLLGRSSQNIIHFLALGSDEIRKQISHYAELSPWTKDAAKKADDFGDSLVLLRHEGERFLVNALLPTISSLNELIDSYRGAKKAAEEFFGATNKEKPDDSFKLPSQRLFDFIIPKLPTLPTDELAKSGDAAKAASKQIELYTGSLLTLGQANQTVADSFAARMKAMAEAEQETKKQGDAIKEFIQALEKQNVALAEQFTKLTAGEAAALREKLETKKSAIVKENFRAVTAANIAVIDAWNATLLQSAERLENAKIKLQNLKAEMEGENELFADEFTIPGGGRRGELEVRQAAAKREDEVVVKRKEITEQITELDTRILIDSTTDPMKARQFEIFAQFEKQKQQIRDLIDKYPELGDAGEAALKKIDEASKSAVIAAQRNIDAANDLGLALKTAFVASIDQSFDVLFDKTKTFGEKINSLMESLGQTILKTLLHHLITKPLDKFLTNLLSPPEATDEENQKAAASVTGTGGTSAGGLLGGIFSKLIPSGKNAPNLLELIFGPRFSTKVPPPDSPIYQRQPQPTTQDTAPSTTIDTGNMMPDSFIDEQTLAPDASDALFDAGGLLQDSGDVLFEGAEKILDAGFELPKLFDNLGSGILNAFGPLAMAIGAGSKPGVNAGNVLGLTGSVVTLGGAIGAGLRGLNKRPEGVEGPSMEGGGFFSNPLGALFPNADPLTPEASDSLFSAGGLLEDGSTTLIEGAEKMLEAGNFLPEFFGTVGDGLNDMFGGFATALGGSRGGKKDPLGIIGGAVGIIGKIAGFFSGGSAAPTIDIGEGADWASQGLGGIGDIIGFAHGGLVTAPKLPMDSYLTHLPSSVTRLASGGRVMGGPAMALIGEGGEDEWVIPDSKMRKMRGGGKESTPLEIGVQVWDQRPTGLKANDVLVIVASDAAKNGVVGKAITQVQAWNK